MWFLTVLANAFFSYHLAITLSEIHSWTQIWESNINSFGGRYLGVVCICVLERLCHLIVALTRGAT